MKKPQFDLNHQYQLYLKRVGLKEKTMSLVQSKETKRAFFGACGQLLILLRDDVGELEETEAIETMDDMINQVADFWAIECIQAN